ncbi:MAG: stage II sporulation protein E [Firmicutes bacterium]|nr:stage II sporulation protein E [Bacillota bacterium]
MINNQISSNKKSNHNTIFLALEKLIYNIETYDIYFILISFLISRANVMNGLTPFGLAFLASLLVKNKTSIIFFIISSLGVFSIHGLNSFKYLLPIVILFLFSNFIKDNKRLTTFKMASLSSLILIVVRLVFLMLSDYLLYDLVMIGFEGVIVFSLTFIFTYSISIILNLNENSFTNEELISGAIMLSLVVAGIGQASIFTLSIKEIIVVMIIISFAYIKGPSMGAAVGITIGLVISMNSTNMPIMVSALGLSGLLSGLFKELGKIGSSLGFVVGSSIMSLYIGGITEFSIGFKETILASIMFIILINILYKYEEKIPILNTSTNSVDKVYAKRIKDMTYKRLKEFSSVFEELGLTFKKVSQRENVIEQKDISDFVDSIVCDVCKDCSLYRFCWEEDFYSTYQSFFDLMSIIELNGNIGEKLLPKSIKKRCMKHHDIIEKANYIFDLYKLNYKWENKILESRQLVSEQLEGVSKIIKELAGEIYSDIEFKEDVEKAIYSELKNKNISVKDIIVTESEEEKFEILIDAKPDGDIEKYIDKISKIISKSVGFKLARDKFSYSEIINNKRIKFKLIKANRYGAVTKVAKAQDSFNYISGDSYTFGEKQNNYFAVVSDGMGIGQKANQESSIAISLLEKFLEAGFDKELALKTINSVLLLKSNDEMSTTIDMSIIDLYSGKGQFIKIGSASTFIKRKNKVDIIDANSLPVGILKDVDFNIYEKDLEDGDFIIMMSDGVLDANENSEDKEQWIKEVIKNIKSVNPQVIADKIITQALSVSSLETKDDMTVLVTKIWRRR